MIITITETQPNVSISVSLEDVKFDVSTFSTYYVTITD